MSDIEREYFSERDVFLMREAFRAGQHYDSLGDWLEDVIDDMGHVVAQHLSHDADQKQAARQAPASGEAEAGYVCHSCGDKTPPPAPFSMFVKCPCGHATAATIAADLAERTHPPAKVPEVCDGKEQEAFERYAARMGYDMTEHPLHYLFLSDRTSTARDAWRAAISYCNEALTTPTPATTPQPEGDGWIKCSERLPTKADADIFGNVWCSGLWDNPYRGIAPINWTNVGKGNAGDTHWKPTGLKRPQPPREQEGE